MATVHWYINSVLYNGSSPDLYDMSNTSVVHPDTGDTVIRSFFHIKKVRREDLAEYTCEAVNNVIGRGEMKTNQSATLVISREHVLIFFTTIYGEFKVRLIISYADLLFSFFLSCF